MAWSNENEERLKSLWAGGATAGDIAKELGISRNSVLGKAHRLGCEARMNPVESDQDKFERIIDLVTDSDLQLDAAAEQVVMPHDKAIVLWRALVGKLGWQAV